MPRFYRIFIYFLSHLQEQKRSISTNSISSSSSKTDNISGQGPAFAQVHIGDGQGNYINRNSYSQLFQRDQHGQGQNRGLIDGGGVFGGLAGTDA